MEGQSAQIKEYCKLHKFSNDKVKKVLLSFFPIGNPDHILEGNNFVAWTYYDFIKNIPADFCALQSKFWPYLNDYRTMISDLYKVVSPISNFDERFLFPISFTEIDRIGFQDIYRKYQASVLVNRFNETFAKKKKGKLLVDSAFFNKQAVANFFWKVNEEFSYGVQIEGNQFRIMFHGSKIKTLLSNLEKGDESSKLLKKIQKIWEDENILGANRKGTSKGKKCDFCSYSNGAIYKYELLLDGIKSPCSLLDNQVPSSPKLGDVIDKIIITLGNLHKKYNRSLKDFISAKRSL